MALAMFTIENISRHRNWLAQYDIPIDICVAGQSYADMFDNALVIEPNVFSRINNTFRHHNRNLTKLMTDISLRSFHMCDQDRQPFYQKGLKNL